MAIYNDRHEIESISCGAEVLERIRNLYLSIFIYALNPILDLDIHGIQRGRLDLNENVLVIDDLGDLDLLYSDCLD